MRRRLAGWRWMPVLASLLAAAPPARALPSPADVRAAHRPSDLTLLDRHGTPVQTLRTDASVRRLAWVPLAEMSPALLRAVVLGEDRRFWDHGGVDWLAVAHSAWANAFDTRTRGASTLTMQLAGLIDEGLARPAGGGRRDAVRKLGQAVTALRLESDWRKTEILEAYLNAVPLRGEMVGIGALSQTLFGKHPAGLDTHEAAIAAALVRAPNAPPRRVAERACALLRLQREDCTGIDALADVALARRGGMPLGEQLAPHFARQALRPDGPPRQRATLDAAVQRVALAALRTQLAELAGRQVEDGAVVVLDNRSGEVLAWVGSSGSFSDAPAVDGVLARRQPGSTLKPFLYGLAFERRLLTPATPLHDAPAQLATAGGLYLPQNYDRDFRGWVSARMALGSSLNVPAVSVAAMLGPDAVFERLNAFGLALGESAGFHGHALALGAADVTLLALTNAYRALANGGVWSPPVLRLPAPAATGAAAPRRAAPADAVHLVTDILADNNARAGTFGLTSALATHGFAAVKTGTSKDLRDNWCVGFTDRYTVGVWVGNAGGEPMHGVSGIGGAAPVWRTLVARLHEGMPSRAPSPPPGVAVRAAVRIEGTREPVRRELFLAGTEPAAGVPAAALALSGSNGGAPAKAGSAAAAVVPAAGRGAFGILSPRDGSVFALDPDIPAAAQRVVFEGEGGTWILDGRRVGQGGRIAWAPRPGRHELALQRADGRTVQTVRFDVRGGPAPAVAAAAVPSGPRTGR